MKALQLLKVIALSTLALIAFFLLAAVFSYAIGNITPKEIYYQIPEIQLYIKRSGNTLIFYKRDSSNHLQAISIFNIRKDRFNSIILFPIESQVCNKTYVFDHHNCLTSSGYNTIWLPEQCSGVTIPPSVSVELPISKGVLNYILPDSTHHKAVRLDKTAMKDLIVIKQVVDSNPMDILPLDTIHGTIEDAGIHSIKNSTGTISLNIRDNCLECDSKSSERSGWFYPCFYYNPSYPNYIFCNNGELIINRQCKDLFLVCGALNHWYYTHQEGLSDWFFITLNPLTIKPLE